MTKLKLIPLIFGPLLFLAIALISPPQGVSVDAWYTIAIVGLMLVWWISEAIPLPVTALVPVVLFPLLDIISVKATTVGYAHPVVFLLIGGFVIALAMEKCGLHKRIALAILKRTGSHANGVIFGFMLSAAFMSMWMPNTAVAALMMPMGLAIRGIILQNTKQYSEKSKHYFTITMLLCIAFGANIGGMATLIGTPTNALLAGFAADQFNTVITFWAWLMVGFPFAVLLLVLSWVVLTLFVYPNGMGYIKNAEKLINKEISDLGKFKKDEKLTATIFGLMVCLWMFKTLLPFSVSDTSISVMGAVLCFAIPVGLKKKNFLLEAQDISKLPWGILLLFGGGLALANAMQATGLGEIITLLLSNQTNIHTIGFIVIALSVVLLTTEFIGNVPAISVMLPVLTGAAIALKFDPLMLLVPATLAASCAFMLPTGTPPNAVVFSSGHLKVFHMVKAGVFLNILAITILTMLSIFWFPLMLG